MEKTALHQLNPEALFEGYTIKNDANSNQRVMGAMRDTDVYRNNEKLLQAELEHSRFDHKKQSLILNQFYQFLGGDMLPTSMLHSRDFDNPVSCIASSFPFYSKPISTTEAEIDIIIRNRPLRAEKEKACAFRPSAERIQQSKS